MFVKDYGRARRTHDAELETRERFKIKNENT